VARSPHRGKIDAAAEKKAWCVAIVRRRDVENKRVQQNHVTRRARILDDLQRDAVVIFSAVHETGDAFGRIAFGVQVTNVRVTQKQPAILGAARAWGWRMVCEVLVNQAV
jgi:hypothetical protein